MSDLPISGTRPGGAGVVPLRPPAARGEATPAATATPPRGAPAEAAMVGAITQALADLPPGTALSVFLAAVRRVTAEVEARNTAAGAWAADPARLPPGLGEVSQRDLAIAASLIAQRLVPDPRDPASPVAAAEPLAMEPPMRDRLYLLDARFDDPALPGRTFYCRDCVTVDGLLALFPQQAATIEVIRIPYPRPRAAVIAAIGAANQNLPVLVLGSGADPALADGRHGDTLFVGDLKRLLHALHVRHGFPEGHP